jgi:hypothetical protein
MLVLRAGGGGQQEGCRRLRLLASCLDRFPRPSPSGPSPRLERTQAGAGSQARLSARASEEGSTRQASPGPHLQQIQQRAQVAAQDAASRQRGLLRGKPPLHSRPEARKRRGDGLWGGKEVLRAGGAVAGTMGIRRSGRRLAGLLSDWMHQALGRHSEDDA